MHTLGAVIRIVTLPRVALVIHLMAACIYGDRHDDEGQIEHLWTS